MTNPINTEHDEKSKQEKKRKQETKIAPLFSWRSILALALGLVLGAGLGFAYYQARPLISPNTVQASKSEVQIQVVNLTTSYMDLYVLANRAAFYVTKTQSLDFLEFLSQKIAEEEPKYLHSADELAGMIKTEYNSTSSNPVTNFKITVTTPSAEETAFFISRISGIFIDYLVSEAKDNQQQQYQNTVEAIETTKAALLDARRELSAVAAEGIASSIENSPIYVMLTAKIKALQAQLDTLTPGLADIIAQGNETSDESIALEATIERTSTALVEAQKELEILEAQSTDNNSSLGLEYQLAQDKVKNLTQQLTNLGEERDSLLANNIDETIATNYLVAGDPTVPGPPESLKLSNLMLLGALAGMVIAWVILNFRWFTRGTSGSSEEED